MADGPSPARACHRGSERRSREIRSTFSRAGSRWVGCLPETRGGRIPPRQRGSRDERVMRSSQARRGRRRLSDVGPGCLPPRRGGGMWYVATELRAFRRSRLNGAAASQASGAPGNGQPRRGRLGEQGAGGEPMCGVSQLPGWGYRGCSPRSKASAVVTRPIGHEQMPHRVRDCRPDARRRDLPVSMPAFADQSPRKRWRRSFSQRVPVGGTKPPCEAGGRSPDGHARAAETARAWDRRSGRRDAAVVTPVRG